MNLNSWSFTGAATGATKGPIEGGTITGQLKVTGTGAVTAEGVLEGSLNPADANGWDTIMTLSASGTTNAKDSGSAICAYPWVRFRLTTLTGTAAAAEALANAD